MGDDGARGGGKTDAGMAWLLYNIGNPKFRGLVIRRNSDDLKDWIDRAKEMYAGCNAIFVGNPTEIRFPTGAKIRTGHLKDESAYTKYQGHEYHSIVIEELTQIPREEDYLKLISSCRSTIIGLIPQVFATTNPGNRGHAWVKQRWNIQGAPIKPIECIDVNTGRRRIFIPSRVEDNEELMSKDPTYIKFLGGLPINLRKAWRDGDWDIFAGQYFEEFSRDVHVTDPFDIPDTWIKFRMYDHGRSHPACCLWGAVGYDGNITIYREYYQKGMNIDDIAEVIKGMSKGEVYRFSVADSAIFANTGIIDKYGGETIGEAFSKRGIYFMTSSKRRVDGWHLVHQYLAHSKVKPPKLKMFSTCKNLIREFPNAICDENKPEDIMNTNDSSNDALDALRYGIMAIKERGMKRPIGFEEKKIEEYRMKHNISDRFPNESLRKGYEAFKKRYERS